MSTAITRKSSDDHKPATPAAPPGVLLDREGRPVAEAALLGSCVASPFAPSHGRAFEAALPATHGFVTQGPELGPVQALRVTGPDRESWAQGVHTADTKAIAKGGGVSTLFLGGKGRIIADGMIFRFADALVITTRADRLDVLQAHLEKLLIMEDAELSRVEGLHRLRWVPSAQGLDARADLADVLAGVRGTPEALGVELLVEAAQAAALLARIPDRADPVLLEQDRVARGVPLWDQDFDAESTPLEAGLDREISFGKGCYVGQEVIAMATFRGRVQWNLVRLAVDGAPPPAGSPLDPARGGKGRVTSAVAIGAASALLGLVHRDRIAPGSEVALADGRTARVLGLPYGSLPGAGVCA